MYKGPLKRAISQDIAGANPSSQDLAPHSLRCLSDALLEGLIFLVGHSHHLPTTQDMMPTPTPCHLPKAAEYVGACGTQAIPYHRGGQRGQCIGATAVELQRPRVSLSV